MNGGGGILSVFCALRLSDGLRAGTLRASDSMTRRCSCTRRAETCHGPWRSASRPSCSTSCGTLVSDGPPPPTVSVFMLCLKGGRCWDVARAHVPISFFKYCAAYRCVGQCVAAPAGRCLALYRIGTGVGMGCCQLPVCVPVYSLDKPCYTLPPLRLDARFCWGGDS